MANNLFAVSVADAIGRDPISHEVLFLAKANISSAFNLALQATDIRGGKGAPILFTYYNNREVTVTLESATFTPTMLALNAGTSVVNGTYTVVKEEGITLSSGSGTLTETPIGNVGVILPSGVIQTVTPSGATISVVGGGNQTVTAIYNYSETMVDRVVGYGATAPSGVELILSSEVLNSSSVKVYDLQITIPNFVISGNYGLSLTATGVSSDRMEGKATITTDPNGDYYYTASWIPSAAATTAYSDIAATPSAMAFSYASRPQTSQISVLGIKGGLYANTNITSLCTFARTSGCSTISVNASTGLVTSSSAVKNGDTAVIGVTYWDATSGSLVDSVSTSVGA